MERASAIWNQFIFQKCSCQEFSAQHRQHIKANIFIINGLIRVKRLGQIKTYESDMLNSDTSCFPKSEDIISDWLHVQTLTYYVIVSDRWT